MVVTLPFVLLLFDFWPLGRFGSRQQSGADFFQNKSHLPHLLFEKLPLFSLSAASCMMTILAQRAGGAINSLEFFSLKIRVANALISYVTYMGKMFVPLKLAVFYPYPSSIPSWKILCACIILISISFFVIKAVKTQPYLLFGWLWYLGTMVPVIGLVQVGIQSMADRYTYIPLIGLFVMVTWGFPEILKNCQHKKIATLSISLLIYLTLLGITWFQVRHWTNNFSLYQHAIDVTEKNYVAHNNLGGALYKAGKGNEAMGHFMRALEIKPDYYEALTNLLASLRAKRNLDQTIEIVEKLLTIYPENSSLYYILGVLYGQKGDLRQSSEKYQRALSYHPEFAQAQFDLAFIYSLLGEYENALNSYKRALEIQSDLVWAYYNVSAILAVQNRVDESIIWLGKAVKKGFNDWNYLKNDDKMKNIKEMPFYKNLLRNENAK